MTAPHGTSIDALLMVLAIAWAGAIAFYFAADLQRAAQWYGRRGERRAARRRARMSVRVARGLGATLLADEAKLRGGVR